jgi:alpha,alpha-trehalase
METGFRFSFKFLENSVNKNCWKVRRLKVSSRKWMAMFLFVGVAAQVNGEPSSYVEQYHPEAELGELFIQVQTTKILGDYKTFVDAIPNLAPQEILQKYKQQKDTPNFDLREFVLANFTLPEQAQAAKVEHESELKAHLDNHWGNLVRHPQKTSNYSSLVALPHPYVVPGGRFREMFYWDSYFTIVGLLESNEDALARGMIDNFAYMIDEFGFVPNGNRSYFLSRSQPPLFAASLLAYADKHGIDSVVSYLPQLETEYRYWMDGKDEIPNEATEGRHLIVLENGDYLNRYAGAKEEPRAEAYGKELRWASALPEEQRGDYHRHLRAVCESGWDFSSRWFKDGVNKSTTHAMDIIPVDLTSLLYQLEHTLALLFEHTGNTEKGDQYYAAAEQRKSLLHKYHFDKKTGTYQDYDFRLKQRTGRLSMAMAYPLYVGAAQDTAAKRVSDYLASHFLKPGGFVSTLVETGEQWDYPNGWAPLQYIGVKGLLNYRQNNIAHEAMSRWLALNEKVYKAEGKMMEKYNVVDTTLKAGGGEYPTQDGFGWTNGVDLAFYRLLGNMQANGQ